MADGEGTPPAAPPEGSQGDPPADPPEGGDDSKTEIAKLRKEAASYRTALRAAEAKVTEFEQAGKTELEKATGAHATEKARADKAEAELLRLSVGLAKGLTAAQAKRLVGSTQEELEADADELIATFGQAPSNGGNGKAPGGRPKERLSGGSAPADEPEEMDPKKLAAMVRRPGLPL